MSADNWAKCPKCHAKKEKLRKKIQDSLDKAYNTMTAKEYDKFKAANPLPYDMDETELREDYELGISDDGEFYVIYEANCQKEGCDFKHKFKHSEKLTK